MSSSAGKPIECRAAVCWSKGADLVIETITVDPPKETEVRVKMVATGICYSDIHVQKGDVAGLEFPVVAGHESVAIVESVGAKVTLVKPGDHVMPMWCYQCGKCPICLKGKRNDCLLEVLKVFPGFLLDGTSRLSCKGQTIRHGFMVSGFSEYSVLPEDGVVKLKDDIPLEKVAIYGCCVPTGYGAVKNTAKVEPGSIVAVVGLGAIGLCALLGARDAKAGKIIGIDINPDKFKIGKKFGATDLLNPLDHPGKKTSDVLKEMTGGLGVDYIFICIGNKAVANDAMESVCIGGGEVIMIAIPEKGDLISIDSIPLLLGKTLKGSWGGDYFFRDGIPKLLEQYMNGEMPTDDLITKYITLDEVNEGFNLLKQGKSIRTIIKYQ